MGRFITLVQAVTIDAADRRVCVLPGDLHCVVPGRTFLDDTRGQREGVQTWAPKYSGWKRGAGKNIHSPTISNCQIKWRSIEKKSGHMAREKIAHWLLTCCSISPSALLGMVAIKLEKSPEKVPGRGKQIAAWLLPSCWTGPVCTLPLRSPGDGYPQAWEKPWPRGVLQVASSRRRGRRNWGTIPGACWDSEKGDREWTRNGKKLYWTPNSRFGEGVCMCEKNRENFRSNANQRDRQRGSE